MGVAEPDLLAAPAHAPGYCLNGSSNTFLFLTAQMTPSATIRSKKILYPNAPWYFAFAILITWIGFSFSYFTQLGNANVFHHLHGASAGLWMILLVVQPILYQREQIRLHRQLGRLGALVLAPLLVLGGLKMMHQMVQIPTGKLPPEAYQLVYYDVILLVMFILFLGLSLRHGKQLVLHARYIVCTVLVILPPAIFRVLFIIPWFRSFSKSLYSSLIAIELVLLLLLLDDRRHGTIHRPYVLALVLFLFLTITMSSAPDWSWWQVLVDQFAAL